MSILSTVQDNLTANQAIICSDRDPHFSEIPSPYFRLRSQISGFTGSFGILAITKTEAMLWTDSRYYLSAQQSLKNSPVQLAEEQNSYPQESITSWIRHHTSPNAEILIPHPSVQELREHAQLLSPRTPFPIATLPLPHTPPPSFSQPIFALPSIDKSASQQIKELRNTVDPHTDWILISKLEDIAWLLNIRGSDIPYYPLVISFLLIGDGETRWYLHNTQHLDKKLLPHITIGDYDNLTTDLQHLPIGNRLLIDPELTSAVLLNNLSCTIIEYPLTIPKYIKSPRFQENMCQCHIRDGVAMAEFLFWISTHWQSTHISEYEAAKKLRELRKAQKDFLGESFEPICAVGPHAASPHYHSPENDTTKIEGLFLVDSGGHYLDGSTDITRTIFLGTPPASIQEDYTLVLKAHINLARLHFPQGTTDTQLDAICRAPLWTKKRNFKHGVGHGIGYITNVHESPPRLSPSANPSSMEEGMIFSNEPGVYREGHYGIRLENIVIVQSESENFYSLKTISLCPFDPSLILQELLCKEEQQWLYDYHQRVYQMLSPLLSPECRNWLKTQTS